MLWLGWTPLAQAAPSVTGPPGPGSGLMFINTSFENASPLQWQVDSNGTVQIFLLYDYERGSPNRAAGLKINSTA